ncbi:MAG TPA: alkaline phosphatase [Candidatus Barnesiella merdipullorum]|nr:alkaline phosphatase [Candidatus Barnesiella merdipullorum]
MKKLSSLLLGLLMAIVWSAQAAGPKYVFYFIGDGMGVNQVNATELFYGELAGVRGPELLLFSQFPYSTFVNTSSANRGVTDSAAAGTALACGEKANNNTVGVDADSTVIYSIATAAHQKGIPVGIVTSGEIDDATPAAFFAHQIDRYARYKVGLDMLSAGFTFYAGNRFTQPAPQGEESLYDLLPKNGYTLAVGCDEYDLKANQADKMVLFPKQSIPYAIDRKPGDMSLADLTRCAIDFLQRKGDGFFLMIEGAKIDWAGHVCDGATDLREVKDLEESVRLTYDFYRAHPDETLIVVTADHETGGVVLGTGEYALNLQALQYQTMSGTTFTQQIASWRKSGTRVSWPTMQEALSQAFGFWTHLTLSPQQEERLKQVYHETIADAEGNLVKSLYEENEPIVETAKQIINEIALIKWAVGSHTAGYVPLYAIGVGAENFAHRLDNTEIPRLIARIAEYK